MKHEVKTRIPGQVIQIIRNSKTNDNYYELNVILISTPLFLSVSNYSLPSFSGGLLSKHA